MAITICARNGYHYMRAEWLSLYAHHFRAKKTHFYYLFITTTLHTTLHTTLLTTLLTTLHTTLLAIFAFAHYLRRAQLMLRFYLVKLYLFLLLVPYPHAIVRILVVYHSAL